VSAELERVTVTAAQAERKARGDWGSEPAGRIEKSDCSTPTRAASKTKQRLEDSQAGESGKERPAAQSPSSRTCSSPFAPDAAPELPQLVTAHVTGGRASGEAVHVRVRLTRLHLVAMGIAAEKVDQCIGVVLHGACGQSGP
jgi:hypothetical protein